MAKGRHPCRHRWVDDLMRNVFNVRNSEKIAKIVPLVCRDCGTKSSGSIYHDGSKSWAD